jgi:hypothetical protein
VWLKTQLERVSQIARQVLGYYRDDGTPAMIQEVIENVLSVYQDKMRSGSVV